LASQGLFSTRLPPRMGRKTQIFDVQHMFINCQHFSTPISISSFPFFHRRLRPHRLSFQVSCLLEETKKVIGLPCFQKQSRKEGISNVDAIDVSSRGSCTLKLYPTLEKHVNHSNKSRFVNKTLPANKSSAPRSG